MPLDRPSYAALIERIGADFVASWTGMSQDVQALELRHVIENLATLNHAAYGHAQSIVDEILPTRASLDGLQVWGRIFGQPLKPAVAAVGSAVGSATALRELAATNILFTSEAGGVYELTADAKADEAGVLTVSVRATETGTGLNLPPNATLILVSPEIGIEDAFTVSFPGLVGADEEDVEAYRVRILDIFRRPPQGGALHDYRRWALQVPGVARAWALPADIVGLGNVTVYVATAEDEVVPPDELLEQVRERIAVRQRADASVSVAAPTVVSQDVLVFLYDVPVGEQASVREAVDAAVRAVFAGAPAALDPLPSLQFGVVDVEARFYKPQIAAAVGDAVGYPLMVVTPGTDVTPTPDTLTVYVPGDIGMTF